jgi:hypothetical protein
LANLFSRVPRMTTAAIGELIGWRVKAIQEGKRFERISRKHSYDEHDPRAQIFRPVRSGRTLMPCAGATSSGGGATQHAPQEEGANVKALLGSNGLWCSRCCLACRFHHWSLRSGDRLDLRQHYSAHATVVRAVEVPKAHGFTGQGPAQCGARAVRVGRDRRENKSRTLMPSPPSWRRRCSSDSRNWSAAASEAIQARKKAEATSARRCSPLSGLVVPCTRPIRRWPACSTFGAHFDGASLPVPQVRVQWLGSTPPRYLRGKGIASRYAV